MDTNGKNKLFKNRNLNITYFVESYNVSQIVAESRHHGNYNLECGVTNLITVI